MRFQSKIFIVALGLVFTLSGTVLADGKFSAKKYRSDAPPCFSDFPVSEDLEGKPAAVDLTSHPRAKMFKTHLKNGAAKGPNFAGHYTVVLWGCGSPCQEVAIVNARNGKVFIMEEAVAMGAAFRYDSNLLIANPPLNGGGSLFDTRFYRWEDEKLHLLYEAPMDKINANACSPSTTLETWIEKLLDIGEQVSKTKDIGPIRFLLGGEGLRLVYRPGACFQVGKHFGHWEMKGWHPESIGTQDPLLLLAYGFSEIPNIKKAPLVVLKDKKFDPYLPNSCEKSKKWHNRWLFYPGDYLSDRKEYCLNVEGLFPADKTLLYFSGGLNFYFGLRQEYGRLILHYFGIDSDCDA